MTALTPSRDALAKALDGHAFTYPDSFCECGDYLDGSFADYRYHLADALLASGAVIDATALADDEALVERVARILIPGEPPYSDVRACLYEVATALTEPGDQS